MSNWLEKKSSSLLPFNKQLHCITDSQRTLTMFVGVVTLHYQHHMCYVVLITECHNSHKHSQSPLTTSPTKLKLNCVLFSLEKTSTKCIQWEVVYYLLNSYTNMAIKSLQVVSISWWRGRDNSLQQLTIPFSIQHRAKWLCSVAVLLHSSNCLTCQVESY